MTDQQAAPISEGEHELEIAMGAPPDLEPDLLDPIDFSELLTKLQTPANRNVRKQVFK